MQQQRLFEIVWLLTEKGSTTARQLAQRFGVSMRTIYRDVDTLSAANIPVYCQPGKGGGIHLLPDFVLDKSLFSKEEQAAIVANLKSLSSLGAPGTGPLLEKLAALFGPQESWLEVDFAPWGGGEDTRALFTLLQNAILRRRVLRFDYTAIGTPPQQRTVHPAKVLFRGQGWYLHAFCETRQAYRFFKLSRIHNAVETGDTFIPVPPPPPGSQQYTGPWLPVVLRLGKKAGARVLDEFMPEQVEKNEDGSFTARCNFPTSGNWLAGYILSFGPDVEVLEPASLRREMAALLKEMSAHYTGD